MIVEMVEAKYYKDLAEVSADCRENLSLAMKITFSGTVTSDEPPEPAILRLRSGFYQEIYELDVAVNRTCRMQQLQSLSYFSCPSQSPPYR